MQPDDLLCYCFHVTHRKVTNFARIRKPTVASELSECGGAGTGCGWCVPFLRQHFEAARTDSAPGLSMSADDYAAQRAQYLRDRHTAQSDE